MKKIIIASVMLFPLIFSCGKWLDVKPFDKVSEDQVFGTVEGFRNTLNGIYIEMNNANLYGKALSIEFIEIIAGRYAVNQQNSAYYEMYQHEWAKDNVASRTNSIWQKAYSVIANLNVLIHNCDKQKEVLTGINYNLIKGEALALRAYLHFDLFRLFGPVYSLDDKALSIPYNTEFRFMSTPRLPTNEFMSKVMADIESALELLQKDPIIMKGPNISEDIYDYFRNRTTRLNYYATQVLYARAALYMGNPESKARALEAAKIVIAAQSLWFPFCSVAKVKDATNPDRVLFSEILFALENPKRNDLHKDMFDPVSISDGAILAPQEGGLTSSNMVFGSISNMNADSRGSLYIPNRIVGTITYKIPNKFQEIQDQKLLYSRLVPLVRISEAYYIAAECEADQVTKNKYLNTIRSQRGYSNQVTANETSIRREYNIEFLFEGQLFYYYKRTNRPRIPNGTAVNTENLDMAGKYVIPLPISEDI